MAFTLGTGSQSLNELLVDSLVKQTAARTYKIKQVVSIVPTSALDHTFFRADPAILTGQANASIQGVPFGAAIPQVNEKYEAATARVLKFAAESNIAWEYIKGSAIDIMARKIFKATESCVNAVDTYLWNQLTQDRDFGTSLLIQSYSISADRYWNGTSAAIAYDVGVMKRRIGEKYYDTSNVVLFVSPRDEQSIADYLHSKGSQYADLGQSVVLSGEVTKIAGARIVVTPTVTASFALMVVPNICATVKQFEELKSTTITDPYKSVTVRIVEEFAFELTDPLAVVLARGTQGVHNL